MYKNNKSRCVIAALALSISQLVAAQPNVDAQKLAQAIIDQAGDGGRVGVMNFKLVNKSGRERNRQALLAKVESADVVKIAILFTKPAAIADTAFLSHDYKNAEDLSWLYLPATEKVRRLPASDRGDYFMGTDLTYGDIKDHFRFAIEDWSFSQQPDAPCRSGHCAVLNGKVKSKDIAAATGYSSFSALVDIQRSFPIEIRYKDADGSELKTVDVSRLEKVGETWMATEFSVDNHQTNHKTHIWFEGMRSDEGLSSDALESRNMGDGFPDIEWGQ